MRQFSRLLILAWAFYMLVDPDPEVTRILWFYAGIAAPRAVFPFVDDWPMTLGIMAGMDQKDSFLRVRFAGNRLWQWHVHGWLCSFFSLRAEFLSVVVRPKMLGVMAGVNQKDSYVARCPVRCRRGEDSRALTVAARRENRCDPNVLRCFSAFSAHQRGHHHPCCGAEANFRCLDDHRDSPVARGEGGRFPCLAGRASSIGARVQMTVVISQLQLVENFALRDVQMVQVSQTSESLGTGRVVQLLDQVVDMPAGVPTCGSSSTK